MIAPDMATMLAFLFTDAAIEPGPLREILARRRGRHLQRHHHRRRHLDERHALAVRHRHGSSTWRAAHRARARSAACELPRGPHRGAARPCPPGREGRRGRDEVRHGQGHRRGDARGRAQDRVLHRQFAAGEDGDRRRGPELGPRGHGRRQSRRSRRPRQAVNLFSATSSSPRRARWRRPIARRSAPPT